MAINLPPHIWFVRSNRGSGSYPVTPEGWRALWTFAACVAASAIVGGLLAVSGATLALACDLRRGHGRRRDWFIATARRHTDFSISYNDYVKDKKNA